jgi:hypothetical protein
MNQKQLLKNNDKASSNKHMFVKEYANGKKVPDFSSLKKEDKYYGELKMDTTNDRWMVANNLRPGLLNINRAEFKNTENHKELLKRAKKSVNNKLRDEFLFVIASLKQQPRFNFKLN